MVDLDDIKKFFRGRIVLHEPLRKYTSFCIGGPAEYYIEPADRNNLIAIANYLKEQSVPFLMMGKGTNMLVSDEGIRGAVINVETGLCGIRFEGEKVVVDAGVTMARFVDFCIQQGLKGMEMLPGIPGTIGGAIMMNAGAYGGEISDYLLDVEVLRSGTMVSVKKNEANFSYRHSGFEGDIILRGGFQLPKGDKAELMKLRREYLVKRSQSQPLNLPNSGSVFKNPPGTHAARLIEDSGLKGKRSGKAQISEKHANFIVNLGGAKAMDVLHLINLARTAVMKQFGVQLELEVRLIGFPDNVLKEISS